MRNLKKQLIIFLLLVFAVTTCAFVACNGKNATLNFNTMGGGAMDAVTMQKGTLYTLPDPSRGEEYSFEGWYLSEDLSGTPVTEVLLNEDTTVYAKWEQLYAVNLDLDGGSLSTQKLYLKQGANISQALQALTPTKTGYVFGAWFNGSTELSSSQRMPASAVNLTAKYKAPYTLEVYLQNQTLDGYDLQPSDTLYDYEGATVTLNQPISGYLQVQKEDSITSITLGTGENLLRAYYDRRAVTISFNANYPDGSVSESIRVDSWYGVPTVIPENCYFEIDGYYLKGWATSANGEIVYESDYLDRVLYNGTGSQGGATIVPERTMALYAVWEKGYSDMLGGDDYIFVELNGESQTRGVAYLKRGSYFFEGQYFPNSTNYNFLFTINADEKVTLMGKLNSNGTFIYIDDSRRDTFYLYDATNGSDDNVTLAFDNGNGVTYKNGTSESYGTYVIEDSQYIIDFTSGELNETTMYVRLGTLTSSGKNVFVVRSDEWQLGKLTRFAVYNNSITNYIIYQLEFDGYGTAYYYNDADDDTAYATLTYTRDGDTYTLSSSGSVVMTAKVLTLNGSLGYMSYIEALDQTITEGNTILTLDGMHSLTYNDGTNSYTSYYTVASSQFGGYIVSASIGGQSVKFLITSHSEEVVDSVTQETSTTTVYDFVQKLPTYAEYIYKDAKGYYYAPLIVIDDEREGYASIYGYTTQKTFLKVLEGTYEEVRTISQSAGIKLYQLTATSYVDPAPQVSTNLYDISQIKSVIFALDSSSTSYNMSYWYQVVTKDDVTQSYEETYTGDNNSTLVMVGGMGIYTGGGQVYVGTISISDGLATLSVSSGSAYFEIDEQQKTFVRLAHLPYNMYAITEDGQRNANEYIALDGKGGAVYTKITTTTDEQGTEQTNTQTISGTFAQSQYTSCFGIPVYTFTSETKTFGFIQLYSSSYAFYAEYVFDDATFSGKEYTNAASGLLQLDGFGYAASYTNLDGTVTEGRYSVSGELVILSAEGGYMFFDVKDDNTFTIRGNENGGSDLSAYIVFDNQRMTGEYIHFDGYGKAQIFELYVPEGETDAQRRYIDENATYTISGDIITVNFTSGSDALKYVGKLSTFTYSGYSYRTFELIRENSIVKAYVADADWTVLILDDAGKAVRYQDRGQRETGTYRLVTESLLYYVNDDSTDACLYYFDPDTGKVTLCESLHYNYYTEDLQTLLFTRYGFVIRDGVNAYYYTVSGGNATLYQYDEDAADRNEYGFVVIDFGRFNDTIEFENQIYYKDDGYAVRFARQSDNQALYPFNGKQIQRLSFSPLGGETYQTSATVILAEGETTEEVSGYVAKTADGLFLVLSSGYARYQFEIEVKYHGIDASYYTIKSMVGATVLVPYTYAYYYVMYYLFMGVQLPNNYGLLSITQEYNEEGLVVKDYVIAQFNPVMGYVDTQGNTLSLSEASYTYDEETGIYSVVTQMPDGYTYELRFVIANVMGIPSMRTIGFMRVQTLNASNDENIQVKIWKIIASDMYSAGSFYDVELTVNGSVIKYTEGYIVEGKIVYIVRETTDNLVTTSTHYTISLTEESYDDVEEGPAVKPYASCEVTSTTNTVVYNEDKTMFVEMSGGKVLSIVTQTVAEDGTISYTTSIARECVEADGVYTVTVGSQTTYKVTVTDGVAVIEEVKEEASAETDTQE